MFRGLSACPLWDTTEITCLAVQLRLVTVSAGGAQCHPYQTLCLLLLPAERHGPAVFTLSHPEEGCIKNIWTDPGAGWLCGTAKRAGLVWRQHHSRGWCAGTPGRAEAGEMAALLCASVTLRGIHENESSLTVWAALVDNPFFFFSCGEALHMLFPFSKFISDDRLVAQIVWEQQDRAAFSFWDTLSWSTRAQWAVPCADLICM